MAEKSHISMLRKHVGSMPLIMPSTCTAIFDDAGHILMMKKRGFGTWTLPGGAIEPEEQPETAAIREVKEETGLDVKIYAIANIYGGELNHTIYPNGDEVYYIMTVYCAKIIGGTLKPDHSEALKIQFFPIEDAQKLEARRWLNKDSWADILKASKA